MKTLFFTFLMALLVMPAVDGREISGKVVGEDNAPLDYVNVVLYRDSTYITGTVTDHAGMFCISTDVAGNLVARVSFVGYETAEVAVSASGEMGTIKLCGRQGGTWRSGGTRHTPLDDNEGQCLVTNVEGSPLAIAGTANDVLARVPMVVDNGGTPEVFGKGTPAIYINCRKVNDLQELSQLNSNDIKNVSVITNPGAAYAANVKSVIIIRTKPPKGDGFSGTLRTDNGFQHYFRTGNSIDLKYRIRGLEVFVNYGWWYGDNRNDRLNDMTTTTPAGRYNQSSRTIWRENYNDMSGKVGFSFIFNDKHSIGAYYQNSWNRHHTTGTIPSEVWLNEALLDRYNSDVNNRSTALPRHNANIYYHGTVGKFDIDFNADYLWYKSRELSLNDELSATGEDRKVNTTSMNRNRMFAEKLVVSHPLWQGQIRFGEEYTNTHHESVYRKHCRSSGCRQSRVREQHSRICGIRATVRALQCGCRPPIRACEIDYYEMGEHRDGQSKTYNNLFPSLNVSTQIGNVRMGLNYSGKTVRPGYGQLDGAVSYINRLTYETGNPYLKPTKMQTVEYMAQWRQFFAQVSYLLQGQGVPITELYGPTERQPSSALPTLITAITFRLLRALSFRWNAGSNGSAGRRRECGAV